MHITCSIPTTSQFRLVLYGRRKLIQVREGNTIFFRVGCVRASVSDSKRNKKREKRAVEHWPNIHLAATARQQISPASSHIRSKGLEVLNASRVPSFYGVNFATANYNVNFATAGFRINTAVDDFVLAIIASPTSCFDTATVLQQGLVRPRQSRNHETSSYTSQLSPRALCNIVNIGSWGLVT